MKIIKTADLQPDDLSRSESLYIYNGLDCAVTYEILEHLLPQLSPVTAATYGLSRSLQGPVLEMNNRGLLVDQERRAETIKDFKIEIYRLTEQVNRMVREGLGFDFPIAKTREYDYPSPDQLRHLFYDHMGIAAKRSECRSQCPRTIGALLLCRTYRWTYSTSPRPRQEGLISQHSNRPRWTTTN
jgi:DNA polymerase I-like protein with 3'-5' exonuclease and polymerase domains